jgi:hypothetical protein
LPPQARARLHDSIITPQRRAASAYRAAWHLTHPKPVLGVWRPFSTTV